ncbi:MAG: Rpn family recombination-promoting nuclease/putative transposase [Clostridia bacterium]
MGVNTYVDIEMQVIDNKDMIQRSVFYSSKLMTEQLATSESYQKLKKVVMINILNYSLLPEEYECYNKGILVLDKHREYILTDLIEYHFIELNKFRKIKHNINDKFD